MMQITVIRYIFNPYANEQLCHCGLSSKVSVNCLHFCRKPVSVNCLVGEQSCYMYGRCVSTFYDAACIDEIRSDPDGH